MDLEYTQEQMEYRKQVRAWLAANVTKYWKQKVDDYDEMMGQLHQFERRLYEAGYNGISVPKEYGGQGLTIMEEIIFTEEAGRAGVPRSINQIGKGLLVPTLLAVGTEKQKKRFIPAVLKGEEIWCQGYSEPNAGSDLASLTTRAKLDGDEWVINGQKVWTSFATHADWCFVLARTDQEAPKHKGITYFLVPMNTSGIEIRPLMQPHFDKEFCEVFFDDVRIPKDSYVGNLNEGWNVANTTLSFERGSITLRTQSLYMQSFLDLVSLSKELDVPETGTAVIQDSYYRQKLANHFIELSILRYHGLNLVSQITNNEKIGPEASIQKLYYSEACQKLMETAMEVQSNQAPYWSHSAPAMGKFQYEFLDTRGDTIHSGTSQIQRNIIAERVLGMPKQR